MKTKALFLALLLAAGIGLPGAAWAKIYKYTDSEGQSHFTDNINNVPPEYRDQVDDVTEAVKKRDREISGGPGNSTQSEQATDETSDAIDDMILKNLRETFLRETGRELSEAQAQRILAWWNKWFPFMAFTFVVAALVWLGLSIHAFTQSKIGWGIANLLLGVPCVLYAIMELDEDQKWMKVAFPVLYFLPLLVMVLAGHELMGVLDQIAKELAQ